MTRPPRIYVAGHQGMVGSAIVRCLERRGGTALITRTHGALDLADAAQVRAFFEKEKPKQVYLAAARVGGIHANECHPAEFIHTNLMIAANVIHAAWRTGVQRLLFLGSSCIYPKFAAQPITEDALLTGALEPTNAPYAVAKIAGIQLCESYNRQHGTDFRCLMPCNLYGPGDNYHPENSHVLPALIRRLHEAKRACAPFATIWGSGNARREFLFVDDLAAACVHAMALPPGAWRGAMAPRTCHLNVGTGEDLPISELALCVAQVVGYPGSLRYDHSRPDGTPRKLLDVSRLRQLGWTARTPLSEGIALAYADFMQRHPQYEAMEAASG